MNKGRRAAKTLDNEVILTAASSFQRSGEVGVKASVRCTIFSRLAHREVLDVEVSSHHGLAALGLVMTVYRLSTTARMIGEATPSLYTTFRALLKDHLWELGTAFDQ